jgi:branched-chain amino acid transport system permease protein
MKLKGWSRRRLWEAARTWLLLALVLGIPVVMIAATGTENLQRVTVNFLIIVGAVVALQVFVGNSGIVSFGHAGFFGAGAYAAAILTVPARVKSFALPGLPGPLGDIEVGLVGAITAGALVALVIALLTGLAFARMQETAMAMSTLALLVMMHTVFSNWEQVTRGTIGIFGIPRNVTLLSALVGSLAIAGVGLIFRATPTGLALQGARDDSVAARSLGISVIRVRLAGWALSALLMGSAGALWAQNILAFGPDQFFFEQTFTFLSMLVIGGIASVTGAVAGTAIVVIAQELLRNVEEGLSLGPVDMPPFRGAVQLTIAVLIMVILIFRPSGLFGSSELGSERARPGWLARHKV